LTQSSTIIKSRKEGLLWSLKANKRMSMRILSENLYKIKDFFNDFLVRLGLTSDNSIEKDLTYSIKKKLRKIERSLN